MLLAPSVFVFRRVMRCCVRYGNCQTAVGGEQGQRSDLSYWNSYAPWDLTPTYAYHAKVLNNRGPKRVRWSAFRECGGRLTQVVVRDGPKKVKSSTLDPLAKPVTRIEVTRASSQEIVPISQH